MSSSSKKHHFVPQAQLRHFAADEEHSFVWVLDKKTGRSYSSSIVNAGSENDLNTVHLPGGKWNFDDLFGDVDGRSAQLVSEIIARRSLAWLSPSDRIALADLVATQLVRTRIARTTQSYLAGRMREIIRDIGYDPDADPSLAMPTDAHLRIAAVERFLERAQLVAPLSRLRPAIFAAGKGTRFVLSDHPVTIVNAFPYGDTGLAAHGVIVVLPIAPELAVSLVCPTIVSRYEAIDSVTLEVESRERMFRFRDGLI